MDLLDKLDTLLGIEINEAKGLSSKTKKNLNTINKKNNTTQKGEVGFVFEREFIELLNNKFANKTGQIIPFKNGRAIDCIIGKDKFNDQEGKFGIRISLKNNKSKEGALQLYFADLTNFTMFKNKHYIIHSKGDIKNRDGLDGLDYYMFEVANPQEFFKKVFRIDEQEMEKYFQYAKEYKNKYNSVVEAEKEKRKHKSKIDLPLQPNEIANVKKQLDKYRNELIRRENNEIRQVVIANIANEIRSNMMKINPLVTEKEVNKAVARFVKSDVKFPARRLGVSSATGKPQYRYQVYVPLSLIQRQENKNPHIKILINKGTLNDVMSQLEDIVRGMKNNVKTKEIRPVQY